MTTIVDGKYRLEGVLGSGAFGTVFKAEHTGIGRIFAIKVLEIPDELESRSNEVRARFMREAKILGKLDHTNVVQVYDFGEYGGRPYLVMEFLEGRTLYRRLKQHGGLSEAEIYRIGTQILAGLVRAHDLGLVHRDLKPANVMLVQGPTGEEDVKLLDFGVATAFREDSLEDARNLAVTAKGSFVGTPQYAAPEQFMGRSDARSDVYGVGLLLWEMVTGKPAVKTRDVGEAAKAHMSKRVWEVPRDCRISRELRAVIERALQKKPGRRYADALAMLEDMQYLTRASTAEQLDADTVISEDVPGFADEEHSQGVEESSQGFEDQPGDILVDKYELGKVVGAGGFSRVHEAIHIDMERKVAVKLLDLRGAVAQAGGTTAADLRRRFGREAKLCSQLNHPNTITVYDFGVDDHGRWYIVMEYVEGLNLYAAVQRHGKFEPRRAARVARDVLRSLSEAHHLGVLHRDLKPGNVMLTTDYQGEETTKVLDFGISTIHGLGSGQLKDRFQPMAATQLGTFVGTPQYAAPEQFLGEELTPAADLYAAGLVLWEMLCGEPAIEATAFGKCLQRHLDDAPWRLPDDVDVPRGLRDILYGALEKEPKKRYLSAAEMADDIDAWLEGEREEFEPSPVTQESWEPKMEYRSTDQGIIDPNLQEDSLPEFLKPPPAAKPVEPPSPAEQQRRSQRRKKRRKDERRRAPREESLQLDYDRAPAQRADRIVRPSNQSVEHRRPWRIPWSWVAALGGILLVGAVVYGSLGEEEEQLDVDLVNEETMYLDLENTEPEPEVPRNRFSAAGIIRALETAGWSVRRTGDTNALANVHQQGYRLSRSGTELEIELVTTKSTSIAQKMSDDTRPPIQVVVFDNKLVRVFPPGGRESLAAEEVVSLLRKYRDMVLEGGEGTDK